MPSIYAQLSKDFWLITKGEILQCAREIYILIDTFVVAILKHGLQYIGHIPPRIFTLNSGCDWSCDWLTDQLFVNFQ